MRWHVGTFGQVTQITKVAVIDYVPVILAFDAIDFHGGRLVDQVEQGWEGVAKAYAAATAVTYIENPFEFVENCGFVIKPWTLFARAGGA
jgi:hypothetical protein